LSSVGWIDFSSTDRERVTQVLALLSETGTLDELGLGQLRDAFSDSLFPGFSTIQTRAKYFVCVPQIFADYWALDAKSRGRLPLTTYLKDVEDALARQLRDNHQGDLDRLGIVVPKGIIGTTLVGKGGASNRPSSSYWVGLRKFGLVNTRLSVAEFCRSAGDPKAVSSLLDTAEENEGDDAVKRRCPVSTVSNVKSNWRDDIRIALTRAEAELLCRKISYADDIKDSIPAQILNADLSDDDTLIGSASFQELSGRLQSYRCVSEACREQARHAALFSEAFEGAHIRFNALIARRLEQTDWLTRLEEAFESWREGITARRLFGDEAIAEWTSASRTQNIRLNGRTQRFIEIWNDAMITNQPTDKIDAIVRRQALDNKGSRSLLKRPLSNKEQWWGMRKLEYRWPTAQQMLTDIREGLAC
jgi:hypothetical protein